MNNPSIHVKTGENGGIVTLLEGDAYQFKGTGYSLDSVNAIVELVRRKGSPENTVIFYNDAEIGIILNDSVMDRPQDKATYKYAFADTFMEWKGILGGAFSQKKFVDFLKQRPDSEMEFAEPLLAKVQNLKLLTEVVGDYKYDDNNNFTIMFKTKDGEKSTKLPTKFSLDMVILKESDFSQLIEFELELSKPKSQDERPLFTVTCPKVQRYVKQATDYEVGRLKKELTGYMILAGKI